MTHEEEYKPKFMEWGIISKENFTSSKYVPIKRWDPLSTVIIRGEESGQQGSGQHRYYGHYSYLSPIRAQRPMGYDSLSKKQINFHKCTNEDLYKIKDVFMADIEGKAIYNDEGKLMGDGYTIIIAEDEKKRDSPFYDKPHRIAKISESCKAVTLINRYPAMARVIDPDIYKNVQKELPPNAKIAFGINILTVSRKFYPALSFNLIPIDVLTGIFHSMKSALLYSIEEAIERDYYDITVSPFFNIGSQVGGSQPRIHSQIYIDLNGDGHGSRLESFLKAFKEMGSDCHLCTTSHGKGARIILETEYWKFYATGSPSRNFHLRFYPNEHIRRFDQLKPNQFQDLAKSLKIIFKALDDLKVDENRNILFNCCPYGYDADFHMFGDIIPHEIIGGAEMADDMRVARKLPEETAEEIRKVIPK